MADLSTGMTLEDARKAIDKNSAELEAKIRQADVSSPALQKEEPEHGALFVPDVSLFSGQVYYDKEPEPYDWLLKESFAREKLGAIVGAPGTGKGTLAIQLCCCAAGGVPWLGNWYIPRPCRSLFLSAEDDEKTIHRRIRNALRCVPNNRRELAKENVYGIPLAGNVALCENTSSGIKRCTVNISDLERLLDAVKPELVVFDTLSRFFAITENDNGQMTQACGVMEEICYKHGATAILIHHAGKGIGADLVADKNALAVGLSQFASRGATALTGAVRWMFNAVSLKKEFAAEIIGEEAEDYSSGHYLAVKVSKKNNGQPEDEIYLERGEGGILSQVTPAKKMSMEDTERGYIDRLAVEIARREMAGEPPLLKSTGAKLALKLGEKKAKEVTDRAIFEGRIVSVKKKSGNGEYLALPKQEGKNQ